VIRPFAASDYRELRALDGVSFEIDKGEFFGIVGRNGSGKSTLLKLLASIYRADRGTIRMAGRLAPFIELGVGFNPELTARENVVLNGVMMGLTPREIRGRLDAIIDFAELGDFAELRLKNYSSGMLVRLAFSVMMEADADVLLIDEVLAVGDASFQQKCADAFREMKAHGKTIVLVTHEMATVEAYCHRAMLVHNGRIEHIGDPAEVGRRYLRLNFEHDQPGESLNAETSKELQLLGAWVESTDGQKTRSSEHGHEVVLRVELELKRELPGFDVGFIVANADGVEIAHFATAVRSEEDANLRVGQRVDVRAAFENSLAPGRYFVHCGVNAAGSSDVLLFASSCVDFVVFGGNPNALVSLPHHLETRIVDAL